MAWTSPKTWTSEPLTSIDLNTYVRDNQEHLKDRLDNSASKVASAKTSIHSTATSFIDIDSERLAITLTTHGGDVLVGFTGTVRCTAALKSAYFNLAVDGVDYFADDGLVSSAFGDGNVGRPFCFVVLVSDLAAGEHTFKMRWKTETGNTVQIDIVSVHPQFWAKEL